MITTDEATAYLRELGITVPSFLLEAITEEAGGIQDCLDANNVSASRQVAIYTYLIGLLALSGGARQVTSQSAPSGASQSFKYSNPSDAYDQIYAALQVVDTHGCAAPLTPAKPGGSTGFMVVKGSRC
ncbi:MAG: hypothetical protein CMH22_16025 [Methylophaga sp.]|nr:hypothetical protein [Methylophaga sp.]MAX53484.1 hypothetical protein [Methylophaga sp.]|tara:strand:+ start:20188 stop:20571 length:384 start_codon:yes stop_codon:yes gene_type:complete